MAKTATWTCDGCGAEEEAHSLDRLPGSWYRVEDHTEYHKADICEACYKAIFKRRRAA